jgi:L-asparagine transporter-like permease
MSSNQFQSTGQKAEKFQRLMLGIILLGAYIFEFIPAVIFVAVIMTISSVFSVKYSPIYQSYIRFKKPAPSLNVVQGTTCQVNRFACLLGLVLLMGSFLSFYLKIETLGWFLVVLVGTMSIIAGTIGFCLGSALYVLIFRGYKNNGKQRISS